MLIYPQAGKAKELRYLSAEESNDGQYYTRLLNVCTYVRSCPLMANPTTARAAPIHLEASNGRATQRYGYATPPPPPPQMGSAVGNQFGEPPLR